VLDANEMLKELHKTRWMTFLLYFMPEIYVKDRFTSDQYKKVCDFIEEMQNFALAYKEVGADHILVAEAAAPKETWVSPMDFEEWRSETWDFEVRGF
jgi:hypothetical protein